MEPQSVAQELEATRARIRALLVPEHNLGRRNEFPRSAVMRALFNPLARQVAVSALSMGAVVASRRAARAAGLWPALAGSIARLIGRVRH